MLGREYHGSKAGGLCRLRSLARVEALGIKDGRTLSLIPLLTIGERVDAEVNEHRELVALPLELRRRRNWARRLLTREARPEAQPTRDDRRATDGKQLASSERER